MKLTNIKFEENAIMLKFGADWIEITTEEMEKYIDVWTVLSEYTRQLDEDMFVCDRGVYNEQ